MKKSVLLLTISALSAPVYAQESSWLDSLKSLVGLGDKTEQAAQQASTNTPSAAGLVDMLTNSLNVSSEQASGGMGAIFNYVKNNVSSEQFGQLSQSIPGLDGLIGKMPNLETITSGKESGGLNGLLNKAADLDPSLKALKDLKLQFDALGLDPEMISNFVSSAQAYLNTEEGKQAKQLLTDGVGKLLG